MNSMNELEQLITEMRNNISELIELFAKIKNNSIFKNWLPIIWAFSKFYKKIKLVQVIYQKILLLKLSETQSSEVEILRLKLLELIKEFQCEIKEHNATLDVITKRTK